MYDFAKSLIRHPNRWLKLIISGRALNRRADIVRWSNLDNFDQNWDERSLKLAARIPPGASVVEFGCGRGAVRAALPFRTDYLGSDIVTRGPDTLVWDLNDGAPPINRTFDVAIFSGVLEYVADIPSLLSGLAPTAATIVASYSSITEVPDILTRRECGWISDLSQTDFCAVFEAAGYRLEWQDAWIDSTLYQFERDA